MLFDINLVDLGLNLRFELVGGALKFIKSAAYLTANLWKLFGTEDQEGQKEQENHLRKTEIHALIILLLLREGKANDNFSFLTTCWE